MIASPTQPAPAQQPSTLASGTRSSWLPWLLLAYALLVATYFVVRPGSQWSETDTAQLTQGIRAVEQSAALAPDSRHVYAQGYGYPVVSNMLLATTGLSVQALQQVAYPLLTALLVFPAWALFRHFTGSGRAAALAVLLLFLQPEFLFVVLRGSHERVLRLLMLVSFWLLARSIQSREQPARFAVNIGLFYLVAFALIATNTLFGLSFVLACGTAAAATWILRHRPASLAPGVLNRLLSVSLTLGILAFIFLFYAYPPATNGLGALHTLGTKATGVVLATETDSATNPYMHVLGGWTSLPVYFLLSTATYLLLAVSAPIWLWQGVRWFRGRATPSPAGQLHWLLYGVFALQGALAILADRTDVLGANLQHRSFPSFAMVATPLVAAALVRWRPGLLIRAAAAAGIAMLAGLAMLKATNEPSLSNKWTFYTPVEARSLAWANAHLRDATVWTGFDERLSTAYGLLVGPTTGNNVWTSIPRGETRSYLITDLIRLQGARLGQPLPAVTRTNRVYDSGAAQLYRRRAETAYQR
jgi:hypothetical protein